MVLKYSRMSVTPKDEDAKKQFWEYRVHEIFNQFYIYMIFVAGVWVA